MMSGAELFPIVAMDASETGKPLRDAVGTSLADVWQGLWGDRLAAWRLKNAAKLNDVLGKELAERGLALNLDKIPERFAYSWFDRASQEDEPEIQALVAKLLANAAEGNEAALERFNVDLLSRLTPRSAELFSAFAELEIAGVFQGSIFNSDSRGIELASLVSNEFRETFESYSKEFDQLLSLGILGVDEQVHLQSSRTRSLTSDGPAMRARTSTQVFVTDMGRSLINALYPEARRSDSD